MSAETEVDDVPGPAHSPAGYSAKNTPGTLHSVSVWASEYGITLAQVATDERPHEITAIPLAVPLVDPTRAIVIIDPVGTQKSQ